MYKYSFWRKNRVASIFRGCAGDTRTPITGGAVHLPGMPRAQSARTTHGKIFKKQFRQRIT